jgi:hypothetical protein
MRKIPILSDTGKDTCCLDNTYLPPNYMGDFALLGFRVRDVAAAVRILAENRYPVKSTPCGAEVTVNDARQLAEVVGLFRRNRLGFSLSDVADHVYRG